MTRLLQATSDAIAQAADLLRAGEVVAFPTETIYGLGADATNMDAVAKIYAIKERPAYNPLIIHVPSAEVAEEYAVFDARARDVATALWPGPITLVLPLKSTVLAPNVTAGLTTIAVRVPAHPVALALIAAAGAPLAAPSANPSGQLSPTTPQHIATALPEKIPLVLAGGATQVGVESTILDLTQETPVILRPGAISLEEIQAILPATVYASGLEAIKAPGQLKRHYATNTPLRLNAVDVKAGEALLAFGNTNFIGAEGVGFARDMETRFFRNLSAQGDLHEAAAHLYAYLHDLDEASATCIAVMKIPETGLGVAINDRLRRASVLKDD